MSQVHVCQAVFEKGSLYLMARFKNPAAAIAVAADIGTITLKVLKKKTSELVGTQTSLTVASVVFDTLQTDARWTADTTGYNFRHAVVANILVDPEIHMFEFTFTPASPYASMVFPIVFEVPVLPLLGS